MFIFVLSEFTFEPFFRFLGEINNGLVLFRQRLFDSVGKSRDEGGGRNFGKQKEQTLAGLPFFSEASFNQKA